MTGKSITLGDCISAPAFGSVEVEDLSSDHAGGVCIRAENIDLDHAQTKQLIAFLQEAVDEFEKRPTASAPSPAKPKGYGALTDQARLVYQHLQRAGSISAREAMNDHGITSAALARRICDLEDAGYDITRTKKVHPITRKRYTRYSLSPVQLAA